MLELVCCCVEMLVRCCWITAGAAVRSEQRQRASRERRVHYDIRRPSEALDLQKQVMTCIHLWKERGAINWNLSHEIDTVICDGAVGIAGGAALLDVESKDVRGFKDTLGRVRL